MVSVFHLIDNVTTTLNYITGINTACCTVKVLEGTLLPSVSSLKLAFMIQISVPAIAAVDG